MCQHWCSAAAADDYDDDVDNDDNNDNTNNDTNDATDGDSDGNNNDYDDGDNAYKRSLNLDTVYTQLSMILVKCFIRNSSAVLPYHFPKQNKPQKSKYCAVLLS